MSVLTPSRRYNVFVHIMALLVSVVILAPFGWLVIASIANDNDLLSVPLHWIPKHPTFERYLQIFTAPSSGPQGDNVFAGFRASFFNSLIVASVTVIVSTTVGVFGAYAFARLRFRGRRAVLMFFLSTYMVPPIALVIPMYLVMVQLHLLDSVLGLIVVYSSFATPFVLWIMGNYFQSIPFELEEAARIDGCSRMGALFRIILPLARPGLLAMMLFAFLIAWDEFLYALIFTSTAASKTIPVAISEFTGRYATNFGLQAAGGVLAALPPVIIAAIFQKQIVGGLSGGAVKG
jgi:multiple sugar transport system permease protein